MTPDQKSVSFLIRTAASVFACRRRAGATSSRLEGRVRRLGRGARA
jgi:hypothetical protein